MSYIALGVFGFVAGYLFDLVSLRKVPLLKHSTGVVAVALLGGSLLMVCLRSERVVLPPWATWAGWALLAASSFLLVYSLFIELPFRKTYIGVEGGQRLVTTGTYALVRHPGVLWYALFLLSLILVSKSKLLLLAAPLWLSLDVLWVILQERFSFAKIFPDYESYKRETPMLLPTRKSIAACIRTSGWEGAKCWLKSNC